MKSLLPLAGVMLAFAAQAAELPAADPAFDRYARPADVVTLPVSGRTLNLDCRGTGSPTVLLFPGLKSWSEVWAKVHDALAARRRVCAFDPPGFGFSGPANELQDTLHIVADLEAALATRNIAGPYVVVGHSAGGLQALAFADRHQRTTTGMVLVDPSYPGIHADFERLAPRMTRAFTAGTDQQKEAFARCAQELGKGPIAPTAPEARTCFVYRAAYSGPLRAALAALETPERLRTKALQLDGFAEGSRQTVNPRRNYGDIPLIVLTRGLMGLPPGATPEEAAEGTATNRAWVAAHEALSRLSTRGQHRSVAGAGHMVQLEKPEAVITAVDEAAADSVR